MKKIMKFEDFDLGRFDDDYDDDIVFPNGQEDDAELWDGSSIYDMGSEGISIGSDSKNNGYNPFGLDYDDEDDDDYDYDDDKWWGDEEITI